MIAIVLAAYWRGPLGQLDTWIAGNTRLPYAIGIDKYLPAAFGRIHPRWGTPYVSLLVQAAGGDLLPADCSTRRDSQGSLPNYGRHDVIVTFIPFLYIFGAGFRFASRIAALSGLAVTLIAIVLSPSPPPDVLLGRDIRGEGYRRKSLFRSPRMDYVQALPIGTILMGSPSGKLF